MRLFSQSLELRAIRTIALRNGLQDDASVATLDTSSKALASSTLMAGLNESFFHYEPCRAAYRRLMKVAEKRSRILSYDDLIEDPALDEEFRDILREEKKKPARSVSQAEELLNQLDDYRVSRIIYEMSKEAVNQLKSTKLDVDGLVDYVAGKVSEARSKQNLTESIQTIGKDGNAHELIDRVLDPTTEKLHKTGYTEFDTRNGGVPTEGVWILAGTTSGGKSVLRMNIMEYMYRHNNLDCLTVSLEMNEEKEARRLAASISRVPLWKIAKGMLTDDDRKKIRKAWRKFHKHGEENECRYALFCPKGGISANSLFTLIEPYKYRVVAIDYVGLLEGVDEKDQWKTLSSIVRQAKVFSSKNKCLVIVLAQLDGEDDRIRYSKGMLEHADACWVWNYSKPEQRELKEIPIQQRKARDQELFPFPLKEEFEIMRVSNPDNVEQNSERQPPREEEDDDDAPKSKKKGKGKPDKNGKKEKRKRDDDEEAIAFDVD